MGNDHSDMLEQKQAYLNNVSDTIRSVNVNTTDYDDIKWLMDNKDTILRLRRDLVFLLRIQ